MPLPCLIYVYSHQAQSSLISVPFGHEVGLAIYLWKIFSFSPYYLLLYQHYSLPMFYIPYYVRIIMNQIKTQNDSVYLMWTCSESEIRLAKMHMHKTLIFYINHLVFFKICKYILWTKCSSAQNETMLDLLQVHRPTKISFYMLWEHLLHHNLRLMDFLLFCHVFPHQAFLDGFSTINRTPNFPIICEFCPHLLHVPGHA